MVCLSIMQCTRGISWLPLRSTKRFVYFYIGYRSAPFVFDYAAKVNALTIVSIFSGRVIWGFGNSYMVNNGFAQLPGFSLGMGFVGAGAVI